MLFYKFFRKGDNILYINSEHIVSVYDCPPSPTGLNAALICTTRGNHTFHQPAKELIQAMERQKAQHENMLRFPRPEPDITEEMMKAAYSDGEPPQLIKELFDFKERLSNLPPTNHILNP